MKRHIQILNFILCLGIGTTLFSAHGAGTTPSTFMTAQGGVVVSDDTPYMRDFVKHPFGEKYPEVPTRDAAPLRKRVEAALCSVEKNLSFIGDRLVEKHEQPAKSREKAKAKRKRVRSQHVALCHAISAEVKRSERGVLDAPLMSWGIYYRFHAYLKRFIALPRCDDVVNKCYEYAAKYIRYFYAYYRNKGNDLEPMTEEWVQAFASAKLAKQKYNELMKDLHSAGLLPDMYYMKAADKPAGTEPDEHKE